MASLHGIYALSLLMFFAVADISVHAKTRHHRWEIAYQFKSPDCFQKLAVTINGQTPGPTINAQQGDTVVVEVKNGLDTENTAIHWHGIRQVRKPWSNGAEGTPWSDGAEGVTQCPILPGETFIYNFTVDRPGTYMYHSHYGMQRSAGLYGMIIVAVPDRVAEPFSYDDDRSLAFSDWWHKSTYEQAAGLASIPFVFVGEPQSLLINGRGRFDCSLPGINGVCNQTNPECLPAVLTVVPGKTYRLRIASVTSLAALSFEIEGHNLTVVEADGHYVKPFVVKNIYIYSGETYSVLLKADQDPSRNYWAAISVVARKPETPTGLAILNYYPNQPLKPPPASPPAGPSWNDTRARVSQSLAIRAHPGHIIPSPATADRTILLLNTQNKIDGHIKWALNNVSFALPQTPYLAALKYKMDGAFDQKPPPDTYDYKSYDIYGVQDNTNATSGNSIYRLEFNSTVDVVLQNANTLSPNSSETHPWHLHGHDFWVLGYGPDKFDPLVDPKNYNWADPIMKNTVPLHPYGWTAIRFRADNPGAWIFHCHIESHFAMGMGVVFAEGEDKIGGLPNEIMGCGLTKNFIRP